MYLPLIGADPFVIVIAGAGILLAAAQDLKTREVPDSLSSGLAVLGFALAALQVSFGAPLGVLLNSVLGFGFGYAVGALLYFAKQWGGGDAKLLAGIGALIGFFSDPSIVQVGVSTESLLLAGGALVITGTLIYLSRHEGRASMVATAVFGTLIALVLSATSIGTFGPFDLLLPAYLVLIFFAGALWAAGVLAVLAWRHRGSLSIGPHERLHIALGPILGSGILALLIIFELPLVPLVVFLAVLLAIAPVLLIISKQLESELFVRSVTPDELVLGDWLAQDLIDAEGTVIIDRSNPGLSTRQIEWIEELWNDGRIDRIAIKDGIAFVPAFVIAFVMFL